MDVIRQRMHGASLGNQGNRTTKRNTERGECQGWTTRQANSNADWLESIDWQLIDQDEALFLVGFSLTVKVCPDSPEAWADAWRATQKVLARLGCKAWHSLTEFTERKRPHRHGLALFLLWDFDDFGRGVEFIKSRIESEIEWAWLRIANDRGWQVNHLGQHVKEANRAAGWAEYMTKHGGRGVANYQRDKASLPPAWQGKSGRMWSASRTGWPRVPEQRVEVVGRDRVLFARVSRRFERSRASVALARAQAGLERHEARIDAGLPTSEATEKQILKRERSARAWVQSTRRAGQPRRKRTDDAKLWQSVQHLGFRNGWPGRPACHRRRNQVYGTRSTLPLAAQNRVLDWIGDVRRAEQDYIEGGPGLGVRAKPSSLADLRAGLLFTLRRRAGVMRDAQQAML